MIVRLLLLLLAVCIDALQFLISVGLFVFALFPGTTTGALTGCVVGSYVMGSCKVGALVLGILGSFLNVSAVALVPIGILMAIILSVAFSVTFGAALILLLIFTRMFYPGVIVATVTAELLPGVNLLPTWTGLVARSIYNKRKEEKKEKEQAQAAQTQEAYA